MMVAFVVLGELGAACVSKHVNFLIQLLFYLWQKPLKLMYMSKIKPLKP